MLHCLYTFFRNQKVVTMDLKLKTCLQITFDHLVSCLFQMSDFYDIDYDEISFDSQNYNSYFISFLDRELQFFAKLKLSIE